MKLTYRRYQLLIRAAGNNVDTAHWINVVACDVLAAFADVRAAYGDDTVVLTWSCYS